MVVDCVVVVDMVVVVVVGVLVVAVVVVALLVVSVLVTAGCVAVIVLAHCQIADFPAAAPACPPIEPTQHPSGSAPQHPV